MRKRGQNDMKFSDVEMPEPIHRPACMCIGHPLAAFACICDDVERCLRGWAGGAFGPRARMTPEQRVWCLEEIARQGDSTHQSDSFASLDDAGLAAQVLRAWVDFARDKGFL
jgi:hypothetical protein